MKINQHFVKVKARAKQESIKKDGEIFRISVKEIPVRGKANKRVIELLSEYFKKSKTNIGIVSGHKSKNKIVEIK
jgi:hypothetical protein